MFSGGEVQLVKVTCLPVSGCRRAISKWHSKTGTKLFKVAHGISIAQRGAEPRALARWLKCLVRLFAHSLEGDLREVPSLAGVFYRNGHDVPLRVHVQVDVFRQFTRLRNATGAELKQGSVGIFEIFDLHWFNA
jgi:hypothetical protein